MANRGSISISKLEPERMARVDNDVRSDSMEVNTADTSNPGNSGLRNSTTVFMKNFIPEDIALFLAERIDSVAELEALLILRQEPESTWHAGSLASRLYINEADTEELLKLLWKAGFAVMKEGDPPKYCYASMSAELHAIVDRLANIYSKHVVLVATLIHSKHRVQRFADAFKLRREG
jgi:hypothetical protein